MSQLYIQNINCEPHWRASGILFILLLIKIICNWQQPNLGFIKYDVHATCVVYYLFFLDRQFRGYVAILVFLKTMASYNPTTLTPSLFTEVPVLSQESERSCICVLGISNLPISTFFYWIFGTFPTVWYFFFILLQVVKKELWWCTGNRASKRNIARWNNTALGPADRLKLLSNCGFELKIPK